MLVPLKFSVYVQDSSMRLLHFLRVSAKMFKFLCLFFFVCTCLCEENQDIMLLRIRLDRIESYVMRETSQMALKLEVEKQRRINLEEKLESISSSRGEGQCECIQKEEYDVKELDHWIDKRVLDVIDKKAVRCIMRGLSLEKQKRVELEKMVDNQLMDIKRDLEEVKVHTLKKNKSLEEDFNSPRLVNIESELQNLTNSLKVLKESVPASDTYIVKQVCESRNISLSEKCVDAGCCIKNAIEEVEQKITNRAGTKEVDNTPCPSDYLKTADDKICYKTNQSCASWQDARRTCQGEGTDLLIIPDGYFGHFQGVAKQLAQSGGCSDYMWVGASHSMVDEKWKWVDGSDMDLNLRQRWTPGRPSMSTWDCLGMGIEGLYRDVVCYYQFASICGKRIPS